MEESWNHPGYALEVAVWLHTHACEIGDAAKVSRDGTNNQSCQKAVAGT